MTQATPIQTPNSPSSSSHTMNSLPQYGFGSEYSFENLLQDNPFLFRVYTPKSRSPFFDNTEPFFAGHMPDDATPRSTVDQIAASSTYADVARHMDWTTKASSPYISTSFSFVWAIWEAVRRYRSGVKHDIEIAVIDARAVSGRAVTALELLRKGTPQERHVDYWKWYRFALEAQDVLVHGSIPGTAVLASIPLFAILNKLPSYLLQPEILDASVKESPLEQLGWDYTERKPSYRQFCQDMSTKFLHMPAELRVRDTAAGSVRLAVAFLRPWFHQTVRDDFELAKTKLCELALVIAQWPGQWWARDHAEIWELTRLMVQTLSEEVREKQKYEVGEEVKTLQSFVDNLEGMVRMYQSQVAAKAAKSRASSQWPQKALYPSFLPKRISHSRSDTETTLVDLPEPKVVHEPAVVHEPKVIHEPKVHEPKVQETKLPDIKVVDLAAPEVVPATSAPNQAMRPHSMVETISCVCTGLLFGAFITLCIMNGQRRTLIMNLT